MSESLYSVALENMCATVRDLEGLVPKPQVVPFADSFVYRYVEQTPSQAIVQKVARCTTTLRAACILHNHGLLQEQASLQRILDELQEDVAFLAFGVLRNEITPLHEQFLAAFYQEEFDNQTGKPGAQDRSTPPRKKIRGYIANAEDVASNPSEQISAKRQISKAYSGYVHAASPHIMDMYGGSPLRFQVHGMRGSERQIEHRDDLWNYFYQGILAFGFAAKSLGAEKLCTEIVAFAKNFAGKAGRDYWPPQPEA